MFHGSWQDADPSTGLNADFTKPVHGGPTALGFDEAFFTAACSTIDGPFTFIENDRVTAIPDRQVSELYDLAEDPGETRDLWAARPDIVAELTALLEKYKRDGRSVPRRTRR